MISLCTVICETTEPGWLENHLPILIDSVKKNNLIREVIIAHARYHRQESEEKTGDLIVRRIQTDIKSQNQSVEHALALHAALDHSEYEYVMFCDPDVFLYPGMDEFYLEQMNKYNLDLIGISHHAAVSLAMTFFPTVVNMLCRKSWLPPSDFLSGLLKDEFESYEGKFLVPTRIDELASEFPNPTGIFDTGCNLLLWAKKTTARWLAFQTIDCHTYTTSYCRGSMKMKAMPKRKIIYHSVGSTNCRKKELDHFTKAYDESEST